MEGAAVTEPQPETITEAELAGAAALVMRYERWRDANPADRLDPVLGPEIQIDLSQWAEGAAAVLARMLEHADPSPFVAAALDGPTAGAEPAGEPLTTAQCDRLRQMVTDHQDALSAVRRALEFAAALDGADREIIAAGRAGLKVLAGSEEEAPDGR